MTADRKIIIVIFLSLILSNIFAWTALFNLSQPQSLEVVFFDVGQGDATFIETPQGHQILIDGGPGSVILEKLGQEMPFWDRSIDLVILSHPESDHISGLIEVLERYRVDYVLWTGVKRDTAEYEEWIRALEAEGAQIIIAEEGQRISASNVVLKVLHPFDNLEGRSFKDTNNTSIVLRLVFGRTSFLFTGDAYSSVEKELLEKDIKVDSDVLKVGHHGSKTSSAKEFIAAVSPAIAVIQCGSDNHYGHPHPEVLAILAEYDNIIISTTPAAGDVRIISNGKEVIASPSGLR